ncbi:CHAT domain-containing protein [Mycena capillaripes]|nr:CHAT domain-containing protein [Mycena capillaripes]
MRHFAFASGSRTSSNNLGISLWARFGQQGDIRDINEAIQLHRQALKIQGASYPGRSTTLSNLGLAIRQRFHQEGDPKDLAEAIDLYREALILDEPLYPGRSAVLNCLADSLATRFWQQGDSRDMSECIQLHREALKLRGPSHPRRGASINNLGLALLQRFKQQGDLEDLDESIKLHREALTLWQPPHPDCRQPWDINEAIELHRQALALRGSPHLCRGMSLNNLAYAVVTRFEEQGDIKDVDEAIELYSESLVLNEAPHPERSIYLSGLAMCFVFRHQQVHDSHILDSAYDLFQQAATYLSSSALARFRLACFWAKTMAQLSPTSSLAAYHVAIQLLPQLAALHLDLPSRQRILFTTPNNALAAEAATCAVGLGQHNTAVELLEASRSIFWSQALHLRTPLDDLATIHLELSIKLRDLARQLEQASFRDTYWDPSLDSQQQIRSIESKGARCRQLNEDWEKMIKEIQTLPGFEDFMQPGAIAALQQAALFGPIVILTSAESSCFALIVTSSSEVQHLRLPQFILPEVHALADLSRGLSNPVFDFGTFVETGKYGSDEPKLARLFAGREGSVKLDQNEKSADPPRLWWCPTGPFAFLPIHAAGIYGKDETDCVSDYVVSSYTPTVGALLNPPVHKATSFKITVVTEPKAPDCSPLPGARKELKRVVERIPKEWLTALVSTEVETVLVHLHESSIFHFACHGVQDLEHPLDSGLILTDGRLKVSQIMRRPDGETSSDPQKSMSLAFLSACETAKGDKNVPDEAMHLAATLLFAGFRGVVVTMWAMNDLDGPKIADTFYEHLFHNCDPNSNPPVLPDLKQAAKALHLAVAKLRNEPNIPFRRWVPLVHYGL